MAIVINGSGTVTGISVGGLPDGIVDAGTLATNSVDSAELIDGSIDNSHLADDAVDSDEIAAGAIDVAHLASGVGGKVLQVVSAKITNEFTSTSSTYADTNVTLAITPSSTSSKVLVMITLNGCISWNNDTYLQVALFRDSTEIYDLEATGGETDTTAKSGYGSVACSYLDSPSSTSAVTYLVKGASANNNSYARFNADGANSRRAESSITLMEIGA